MKIDIDKFLFAVQGSFGSLSNSQTNGLKTIIDFIQKDTTVTDSRYAAYMLATCYHETGKTFLPIEEYGKGKGKKYGLVDYDTVKAYYGRGYVQLTWKGNYALFRSILKVDLVQHPELALEPEIAYHIMSIGMVNGSFTGVGLKRYFNADRNDPVNARKIINGVDCANKIADYHNTFLAAIKASLI